MAQSVTFLHTADLHLGAPFKGLKSQSPRWGNIMLEAIPITFQRIIDVAIQDSVDFVIIAGDIFDGAKPSYADFALFLEGLKQLEEAGIEVF